MTSNAEQIQKSLLQSDDETITCVICGLAQQPSTSSRTTAQDKSDGSNFLCSDCSKAESLWRKPKDGNLQPAMKKRRSESSEMNGLSSLCHLAAVSEAVESGLAPSDVRKTLIEKECRQNESAASAHQRIGSVKQESRNLKVKQIGKTDRITNNKPLANAQTRHSTSNKKSHVQRDGGDHYQRAATGLEDVSGTQAESKQPCTLTWFDGVLYQVGDVVSTIDKEEDRAYYAQIDGFIRDSELKTSAFLSWLVPIERLPPDADFEPKKYTVGPYDSKPYDMNLLRFVCGAPSSFYQDDYENVEQLMSEGVTGVWADINSTVKRVPTVEDVFGVRPSEESLARTTNLQSEEDTVQHASSRGNTDDINEINMAEDID